MNESLLEVLQSQKEKKELSVLMQCNEKTESFGLSLTEEDAHELVLCRNCLLYTSNDMVKVGCSDCAGCSACCHGMGETIVLDPYDIWQLTSHLGRCV